MLVAIMLVLYLIFIRYPLPRGGDGVQVVNLFVDLINKASASLINFFSSKDLVDDPSRRFTVMSCIFNLFIVSVILLRAGTYAEQFNR